MHHLGIFVALLYLMILGGCQNEPVKTMQFQPNTPSPQRFVVKEQSVVDLQIPERPCFFKGMGYSPFLPGESPVVGQQPGNDDRYSQHLALIEKMQVNYLHVFPRLMPAKFFEALDSTDLVYGQDIWVWAYEEDFLAPAFQEKTLQDIIEVIDHTYKVGRPDRLVLFSIGDELQANCISSTDSRHPDVHSYEGTYLKLSNRTPTEIALASLVDKAMEYEIKTYGQRHLYCHTSWTHVGPIADRPDLEVSQASVLLPDMGDLICLNVYTYANGVKTSAPGSITGTSYQGYLEDLARQMKKPIFVTQVGMANSPIAPRDDIPGFGGNTVKQIGDMFTQVLNDLQTAEGRERFCGISVFEFQDEWWKSAKPPEAARHQDPQDPEQWFGLYGVDLEGKLSPKGNLVERIRKLYHSL
nr:hypothetical protein [uncultured Desulfobulbus sp.]